MFKNLSLPIKISIVFFPVFLTAIALIAYINYSNQQEQLLAQVQSAATAQAGTIREALVNMMVTNEEVEDSYLQKISETGDIKEIKILFRLDSLKLDEDYLEDSVRVYRLAKREVEAWDAHREYMSTVFQTHTPHWYLTCNLHLHGTTEINNLSSDRPTFLHPCEQMEALIPFLAEKKCRQCHDKQIGSVIGAAIMKVPLNKAATDLRSNALSSLYIFIGFTVISLLLNVVIFRKFVNHPLKHLIHVTEEIGQGKLNIGTFEDEFDRDEFGKLATAFHQMQNNLQSIQDKLVQQERLSTVGQMASSIVHDFRAPMTNVSVAMDFLQRNLDAPSEQRNQMYTIVKQSLQRMNRMMQELLEFSRGEMHTNFASCTVEECAEELRTEYKTRFNNSKIEFVFSNHSYGELTIDKEILLRAIGNIVNNAEDAMPNGGTIIMTILPNKETGGIIFSIKDTGMGIPENIRTTLFEPFVTSGKKHGTGLGLAIVKKVVDLHGGTITFTSETGKGTEFFIAIPRKQE